MLKRQKRVCSDNWTYVPRNHTLYLYFITNFSPDVRKSFARIFPPSECLPNRCKPDIINCYCINIIPDRTTGARSADKFQFNQRRYYYNVRTFQVA